jgi:hypothetical protein
MANVGYFKLFFWAFTYLDESEKMGKDHEVGICAVVLVHNEYFKNDTI